MLMDFLGVLSLASPGPALSRASLLSLDRKLKSRICLFSSNIFFQYFPDLLCRVLQPEGAVEAPGKVTPCDLGS